MQVPESSGIYIWCARAPEGRTHDWFAIYLGRANNLRERFKAYVNVDGPFGPKREAYKYSALCDLYCKGFDLQIRHATFAAGCTHDGSDLLASSYTINTSIAVEHRHQIA